MNARSFVMLNKCLISPVISATGATTGATSTCGPGCFLFHFKVKSGPVFSHSICHDGGFFRFHVSESLEFGSADRLSLNNLLVNDDVVPLEDRFVRGLIGDRSVDSLIVVELFELNEVRFTGFCLKKDWMTSSGLTLFLLTELVKNWDLVMEFLLLLGVL